MPRRARCAHDPSGSREGVRSESGGGELSRLASVGLARLVFSVVLLSAPLLLTGGHGPSPAWAIPTGHPTHVEAVAIAPDGRRIATGGTDGCVVLWEVGRGVEAELPGGPSRGVRSLCFSPDGSTVAAGYRDATIALWDVATGKRRATLRAHTRSVLCLAFSPDGTRLASGSADASIRLWDVASGASTSVLLGHDRPVCAIRFAPDGRIVASGCAGGQVRLWDLADGKGRQRPGRLAHRFSVQGMAFSPDGSTLATGGAGDGIKLWDLATGRERSTVRTHYTCIRAIEFSDDGGALVAANLSVSGVVERWEVVTGDSRVVLREPFGVCCLAFSPHARLLVTGGTDAVARVWDLTPSTASGES